MQITKVNLQFRYENIANNSIWGFLYLSLVVYYWEKYELWDIHSVVLLISWMRECKDVGFSWSERIPVDLGFRLARLVYKLGDKFVFFLIIFYWLLCYDMNSIMMCCTFLKCWLMGKSFRSSAEEYFCFFIGFEF